VRVPAEAVLGTAQARLSFDACKVFQVVPRTFELSIQAKPQPNPKPTIDSESKQDVSPLSLFQEPY